MALLALSLIVAALLMAILLMIELSLKGHLPIWIEDDEMAEKEKAEFTTAVAKAELNDKNEFSEDDHLWDEQDTGEDSKDWEHT